ncbi:hypothetical protein DYB37_002550 [Aphanomyces astaci]|uniref:Uncharacterized protein n=1 Tax=Aphanomyces astaci TaxID=112090 RepID=A0A3R7B9U0_APHAT|nr:hypothetical protein DYB35_003757 [Aphanomyces astaci]RHZ20172.1 hypothetical protein DYB37_002550 [Aphanomyces astaci]
MLGTLKNRMLEGGKQLKSTLEEHSAEMNKQRIQMNINMNSASERLTAVAAAATNVVSTVAKSTTSGPTTPASVLGTKEPDEVAGGPFFASFVHRQQQVLVGHHALVETGEKLSDVFTTTRRRVTAEAQSVMFLQHNFQNIAHIKDGIRSIRNSIASLVTLMEEVEQLLMQRALGDAFAKDLHTYHTIVTYQGHAPVLASQNYDVGSLESIEMAIQPDEDLETFYNDVDDDVPTWQLTEHDESSEVSAVLHDYDEEKSGDDEETKSQGTVPELPSQVPTLDGNVSHPNEQDD